MAGVIANRVASANHGAMIASAMRGIPLLGILPRQAQALPERHLGLVLPGELDDIDALLDRLADQLELQQDAWAALRLTRLELAPPPLPAPPLLAGRSIAVVRDAAFAFLYPANLDTLRAMGATLLFFSPLANDPVPAQADAVYLPGGYPELHARQLAQAADWQASIRLAHASGMPIVAECGGMMALADTLDDQNGSDWPMAGLLRGAVKMQPRLAGIGAQGLPTPHGLLRGHTFHYSKIDTGVTPHAHTLKNPSQAQGEAVYREGSLTASYFHAYFPSCPAAVAAMFTRNAT